MHKLKVGILGCLGSIGSRHAKNFEELGCEVIGYDPIMSGQGEGGPSLTDVIHASDAVVIASPTQNHSPTIRICDAYKKPMLVEKPIVFTREEMSKTNLEYVKMVGYNLRFHSCVRKVREWLGQGWIGKPIWARFIVAQYSEKKPYLRDGVVLNWSHEIDLALHLLGEAKVLGSVLRLDPEDMANIVLLHKNPNCHTTIHLDYLTQPERRGFAIIGEYGSIDADLISRQAFLKDRYGNLIHCHFGKDTFDVNYLHEAMSFLSLLKGQISPEHVIGCTAEEAMAVMDICLTAKEKNLYEQT